MSAKLGVLNVLLSVDAAQFTGQTNESLGVSQKLADALGFVGALQIAKNSTNTK